MTDFFDILSTRTLLFDGSMGALLSSEGHLTDCPELLCVTSPDVISSVHTRYIAAGANVVITNSLGASPIKLRHKGLDSRAYELALAACRVARECAGDSAYVAFDAGTCGEFLAPAGTLSPDDMIENFLVPMQAAKDGGADFVLLETMTDIAEARLACLAAMRVGIPVAASFTFEKSGRTLTGGSPECAAITLRAAAAKAVGVNCSTGPEEMAHVVRAMHKITPLPVIAQPNAGLPQTAPDGTTHYPFTAETMLPLMGGLLEAGAGAIGGCCGTTPEHIRAFSTLTGKAAPASVWDGTEYLCSARQYVPATEATDGAVEVEDVEDLFDLDPDDPAAILSLSGMSPDEAAEMVTEAQTYTKAPLIFRCDDPATLRAALISYCGRAGVYTQNAGCAPVAQEFGAYRFDA